MVNVNEYLQQINDHLMEDEKPSMFFQQLMDNGIFDHEYPLVLLGELQKTDQNPTHHPEGNVWNHTILVVNNAAKVKHESSNPRAFMWAALLHDIGKPSTTRLRKGKLTSYDHDKVGEKLSNEFLRFLTQEEDFIHKVAKLVRWHMQVLMVIRNLPFADIKTMVKEVDLREIAMLGMCDRLGRGEVTDEMLDKEKANIQLFIKKCTPFVNQ